MSNDSRKIYELESIRGLAALLVVFYHLPKWNPILDIKIINNGYLMVELFFVISGFVIFNAYSNRINSRNDLIKFQFLRFARLYPVHLIFLLLFLSIEILRYITTIHYGAQILKVAPFSTNSIQAFIEQAFLLQSVLPNGNATTYNAPAWSLSVEFYTYLIFALILLLSKHNKIKAMFALACISISLLIFKSTFGMENLLRCFAGFFLGCLIANYANHTKIILPKYISLAIFLLLILFLLTKNPGEFDFFVFFLTGALIISLLNPQGILNKLLKNRILLWLGEISYSLYMSHVFIIWFVSQIFTRILGRYEANGPGAVSLSVLETIISSSLFTILVLLVSQLIYTFIEKPFREKSRKFISRALIEPVK
ncbi:MAG: acyltransferase [Anaerolineae bacterium]|nr:acyltransferase [Anaerolineae bacterium]